jgi:hypothetical protein
LRFRVRFLAEHHQLRRVDPLGPGAVQALEQQFKLLFELRFALLFFKKRRVQFEDERVALCEAGWKRDGRARLHAQYVTNGDRSVKKKMRGKKNFS